MNTLFSHLTSIPQDDSNEWYTPARYVDAARLVMGSIDLDPASCEVANRIVRAAQFYSQAENGLSQHWYGRVWLNPPYGTTKINDHRGYTHTGASNIKRFLQKLLHAYSTKHIEQAVLLCRAECKASWFRPLWNYPICFCEEDIHFHYPDGSMKHHRFGTVFVYFGCHEQKFIEVFSKFGVVVTPDGVHRAPAEATSLSLWDSEVSA